MSLTAGTRLGRYEILAPLGAGGMGEVYRARDTRLDREVAIKILPESVAHDPERLARFDREAKAVAALSHPNILALHDAGTENGATFAVMELLDGETLRERLTHGALPVRKAVDITIQIARGLAAAHAKGLVHRDLKPENVFLVADGQVKILDFGLAKSADADSVGSGATETQAAMTDPGTVLGTVGYMAPEQVRGHAVDARTDLFALGTLLYEMLTGDRAFRRDTAAETMTAILREDPPDLPAPQMAQAPALDRIVRHCLEKNPAERFQSARDVAFALEAISGASGSSGSLSASGPVPAQEWPRGGVSTSVPWLVAAALVLIAATAWLTGYLRVGPAGTGAMLSDIRYQPVSFDEGFVFMARFARDGRTIVYSADWENQQRDVFVTSVDSPGARPLNYKGSDLLALAPDGALAILMDSILPTGNPYHRQGTIARASLTGGAPRKELDQVSFADFAPDGSLAVVRWDGLAGSKARLEWPQGHAIVEQEKPTTDTPLPNPRVSPSGSHVAYFTCDPVSCVVTIATNTGSIVAQSQRFFDWWGLAWAPSGQEVWFAVAESSGQQCTVLAIDLAGRQRLIYRAPGALTVHDIASDGRLLASFDNPRRRLEAREAPTSAPRDLSWKEGGQPQDVAANGLLLFDEQGDSGGPKGSVYVRRLTDPEPVRISDGRAIALADDGTMALVLSHDKPLHLSLVPTTGLPQTIDVGPIDSVTAAGWLADGRLVVELTPQPGEAAAVFVRAKDGGPLTPLLPANVHLRGRRLFAPDGERLAAVDNAGAHLVCTVPATGAPACTPLPGTTLDEEVAGWTADGKAVFVYRRYPVPVRVEKVDVATGRREFVTDLRPASAAVSGLDRLFVLPNGAMFYNYGNARSALYVISGLK